MAPFAVLDVNVLRHQRVVDACLARFERHGEQVAVAQIALFELTQHPDRWDPTVMGSLRLLARRPEAVAMTRSSKTLGVVEEATGTPTISVVTPELTEAFRALLRDIGSGSGGDLQAFRGAVESYRKQRDHERHADDSLQTAQTLKSMARASCSNPTRCRSVCGARRVREIPPYFKMAKKCTPTRSQRLIGGLGLPR